MAKKKKEDEGSEDSGLSQEEQRRAALAGLFKETAKKYGKDSVCFAKDFRYMEVPRISTGVFPLDYAFGGGVPVGRITMFYGHKSSGKTTTLLRTIGNAQKQCSACWTPIQGSITVDGLEKDTSCNCGENRRVKAVYLDVEGTWDNAWSQRFLDTDDLILAQPETAEQTIDIADTYLRSGLVDIIVIDSIAFMTATAEIERSATEATVGVQARLVGTQMRKFVSGINSISQQEGRRPTVIFTNQIRQKVGVMFGSPDTIPGGLAQGFATSAEARYSCGKYVMDDASGKPISVEQRAKIEKNKTAPAKMEAEWKMILSRTDLKKVGDIMDESWALSMGEKTGLVDVAHARVSWNGETYHGKSALERHWMQDRADYESYKQQLMKVLLAA